MQNGLQFPQLSLRSPGAALHPTVGEVAHKTGETDSPGHPLYKITEPHPLDATRNCEKR